MEVKRVAVALSVLVCVVCMGFPFARVDHHTRGVTITGDLAGLTQLHRTRAAVNKPFPTIRLVARNVPGVGTAEFVFRKRKLPPAQAVLVKNGKVVADPLVPTLLQGKAFLRRARGVAAVVPASIAIIKSGVTLQFAWARTDSSDSRGRSVLLKAQLRSDEVLAARALMKPGSSFARHECGATQGNHSPSRRSTRTAQAIQAQGLESYRIITLSTDADLEWYARYGEVSNAEIAATINAAEAMYQEQLGIRFAVVRQHVYTDSSPYVSANPSALLTSFRTNEGNPRNLGVNPATFDEDVDAKYLFTGKELDGATVGLSYVGAICWSPRDAYGLVQDVSRDINITVFAHEMGHTLGAQHDTSDRLGIMYPQVGFDRRYFTPLSIEQINRHFSWFGKCISEQMMKPNLISAKLEVRRRLSKDRKRLVIKGSLISSAGRPIAGEMVKLTFNKKNVILVPTDDLGLFSYSVRKSRFSGKTLLVYAQAASNDVSPPEVLKIPLRA